MLGNKPRILGHRGASGYAPENTMAAFRLSMEMGSDGLEFDVQMTKDGVPVVIHDEKLRRTTGARGLVCEYTWKEILSLDAGEHFGLKWKGEKIPSLEEVLTEFSHAYLNIEIKNSEIPYEGLEEKVVDLIDRHCHYSNIIVSSFNHQSVLKIRSIAPQIPTGFLYGRPSELSPSIICGSGVAAVHPDFRFVTQESVLKYHQQGLKVNTWTVNRLENINQMIQIGVDGIISNYPDRVKQMLENQ